MIFFAGIIAFNIPNENEPALNLFAMIGVCCLANIGRVLFSIFRPVDSVNEALEKHKDGEGWFIGRLLGGLLLLFGVFSCLFKSFGEFIN